MIRQFRKKIPQINDNRTKKATCFGNKNEFEKRYSIFQQFFFR